jgi:hypothetical protein
MFVLFIIYIRKKEAERRGKGQGARREQAVNNIWKTITDDG